MDLLCIDTCSATSFTSLVRDGEVVETITGPQPSSLLPDSLLRLSAPPAAPAGLVVARGPGSFTGIKVGLAGAWGFARARGLPMVGVDRLEALALAASRLPDLPGAAPDRLFTATVPAWAGMVYAAVFGTGHRGILRKGSYLLGLPAAVLADLPAGTIRVDPADPTPWEKIPEGDAPFSARVRVESGRLAAAFSELGAARILAPQKGTGQVRPLFLRMTEEKSW